MDNDFGLTSALIASLSLSAAVLLLYVLATYRVVRFRSGADLSIWLIVIWVIPLFGALAALFTVRPAKPPPVPDQKSVIPPGKS